MFHSVRMKVRLGIYGHSSFGKQVYAPSWLGDRVRVNKRTGTRHFVYDSQSRVVAENGASASEAEAEFIGTLPLIAVNSAAELRGRLC